MRWSVGFSEFDIEYLPRKLMQGQALADFVTEFLGFPLKVVAALIGKPWTLFVEGSSCQAKGGKNPHN